MGALDGKITIENAEYRPCKVDGKIALFHRWNAYCKVVGESYLLGGAPAGQVSYTLGMVEYEDGSVAEVEPHEIKFLDGKVEVEFEEYFIKENEE